MDLATIGLAALVLAVTGLIWKTTATWVGKFEPVENAILSVLTHPSPRGAWSDVYRATVDRFSTTSSFLRFIAPIPVLLAAFVVLLAAISLVLAIMVPGFESSAFMAPYYYGVSYITAAITAPGKFAFAFAAYLLMYLIFILVCKLFIQYNFKSIAKGLVLFSIASCLLAILFLFMIYVYLSSAFVIESSFGDVYERMIDTLIHSGRHPRFTYFFTTEYIDDAVNLMKIIPGDDDSFGVLLAIAYIGIGGTLHLFLLLMLSVVLFFIAFYVGAILLSLDLIIRQRFRLSTRVVEAAPAEYFARLVAIAAFLAALPFIVVFVCVIQGLRAAGY